MSELKQLQTEIKSNLDKIRRLLNSVEAASLKNVGDNVQLSFIISEMLLDFVNSDGMSVAALKAKRDELYEEYLETLQ
jgi:hypothetical protein